MKNKNFKRNLIVGIFIFIIIIFLIELSLNQIEPGGPPLGLICVASSGYVCQNPVYNHSTAVIFVTLGQNTGTSWTSANFIFIPQGQALGVDGLPSSMPGMATLGNTVLSRSGIKSGQQISITLPVNGLTSVDIGTPARGSIWVEYTIQNNSTPNYVQIAQINIKAT
jgi:hypothetical protein